jgi:Uma2 family endonuclease
VTKVSLPSYEAVLPDTPYSLWAGGRLDGLLHLPETSRVEIIGGEIVVSPAPRLSHSMIMDDICQEFHLCKGRVPDFPWRCLQNVNLDLVGIEEGYIPDLLVLDGQIAREARAADVRNLVADQIELAIEVTSPSNALNDRRPVAGNSKRTKWSGYALAEIPYYLLVDPDPKEPCITLYSIPHLNTGAYLEQETWKFVEEIVLPEHLGVTIPTAEWEPWSNQR